jgi:hypothetical protein
VREALIQAIAEYAERRGKWPPKEPDRP